MADTTFAPRVFSGIKPSGGLTLGNYLGAIKRWVEMQEDPTYETIYCVVDMHAITVWQDPADLRRASREVAASMIASGIDPERSILFNQSRVPAHTELGWLFSCVARVGWMNRMTQFKDKAGKNAEAVSLGLYAYPALMAADILLYHATHVPVGEDQKQHVELTRDIAAKFNHDYGVDFFPITEPVTEGPAMRVMNLRDGSKKMSKSGESDMERINMLDGDGGSRRAARSTQSHRHLRGARRHVRGSGAGGLCGCRLGHLQTGAGGSGGGQARARVRRDAAASGCPRGTRRHHGARGRACQRDRTADPCQNL